MTKFRAIIDEPRPEAFDLESAATGGAAYLPGLTISSWGDLLKQTPLRVIYFLFAPFPWMVRKPGHILGLIDSVVYMVLAWRAFQGRRAISRNPGARAVLSMVVLLAVVYALGSSNFGTAIRHRAKLLPLLIPIAVPLGRRSARRRSVVSPVSPARCGCSAGQAPDMDPCLHHRAVQVSP